MAHGACGHGETNGRTSGGERRGTPAVVFGSLAPECLMEPFLVSASTVAIAEMGDRTQLLTLMLAAEYRKPWPILAGILCSTVINYAIAGFLGARLSDYLTPLRLDAAVGISMIAMALWTLKPDKLNGPQRQGGRGAFATTLVAFFIAEIGDKTQLATMALAAAYASVLPVVGGATVGMLLANAPVAFLGKIFSDRLPLRTLHYSATGVFLVLGAVFIWRTLHHSS
jgi:putative Ca2+/H+ antiporter (TMEM165/GDT1 family)